MVKVVDNVTIKKERDDYQNKIVHFIRDKLNTKFKFIKENSDYYIYVNPVNPIIGFWKNFLHLLVGYESIWIHFDDDTCIVNLTKLNIEYKDKLILILTELEKDKSYKDIGITFALVIDELNIRIN